MSYSVCPDSRNGKCLPQPCISSIRPVSGGVLELFLGRARLDAEFV